MSSVSSKRRRVIVVKDWGPPRVVWKNHFYVREFWENAEHICDPVSKKDILGSEKLVKLLEGWCVSIHHTIKFGVAEGSGRKGAFLFPRLRWQEPRYRYKDDHGLKKKDITPVLEYLTRLHSAPKLKVKSKPLRVQKVVLTGILMKVFGLTPSEFSGLLWNVSYNPYLKQMRPLNEIIRRFEKKQLLIVLLCIQRVRLYNTVFLNPFVTKVPPEQRGSPCDEHPGMLSFYWNIIGNSSNIFNIIMKKFLLSCNNI